MGAFAFCLAVLLSAPTAAPAEDEGPALFDVPPMPDGVPPMPDGGYVIGAGDSLSIKVFNVEGLSGEYPVRYDGIVMFPYVGRIEAAGVPLGEFNDELAKRLSFYYYEPQVVVEVGKYTSCAVYVLGEVKTPGVYTFDGRATVLEVIAAAGGYTDSAARASTMLVRETRWPGREVRGGPTVTRIDMEQVIDEGVVTLNVPVERGDIIVVPKTFIANLNQFLSDISPSLSMYMRANSVYRANWNR